jgi:hypothetical protein
MTDRSARRRAALSVAAAITSTAPAAPSAQSAADWVARSNEHTRVVLEDQARLAPEGATQVAVSGVDEQITDLSSGYARRIRDGVTRIQQELHDFVLGQGLLPPQLLRNAVMREFVPSASR